MMGNASWVAVILFAVDWLIRIGLSVRVIMRRLPVGVTLAWLLIVLIFPFVGALIYLLIGELRLGNRRAERAEKIHEPYRQWLEELRTRYRVDGPGLSSEAGPLTRMIESVVGMPALAGNALQLLDDAEATFRALIADIDAARHTCHLEFYIWSVGGTADEVIDALLRARSRGVICRVLVDAVGSAAFLKSEQAKRLRQGGVALHAALPVSLVRLLFVRFDLRLHRKIVVIDGEIAYTGSLNLVDPRFFKQGAGVGQWVDAMVRVRGPAVEGLAITFLEDWELEVGEGLENLAGSHDLHDLDEAGSSMIQVVPSGPTMPFAAMRAILMMAIYAARRELVLTTPYFVPDESLGVALATAAARGVEVTIVLPARVDSKLTALASRAFQGDLVEAGVRIMQFEGGLLHTKSITIDGQVSLFGSLNLDPRSLHLNFEITLAIYDPAFASTLRTLQQSYIDKSTPLDLATWITRPRTERFKENVARLVGPLL